MRSPCPLMTESYLECLHVFSKRSTEKSYTELPVFKGTAASLYPMQEGSNIDNYHLCIYL